MKIRAGSNWFAEVTSVDGNKFTIFKNRKTGETRRYKGNLGFKALQGPEDLTENYEIFEAGKWQQRAE